MSMKMPNRKKRVIVKVFVCFMLVLVVVCLYSFCGVGVGKEKKKEGKKNKRVLVAYFPVTLIPAVLAAAASTATTQKRPTMPSTAFSAVVFAAVTDSAALVEIVGVSASPISTIRKPLNILPNAMILTSVFLCGVLRYLCIYMFRKGKLLIY